MTEFALSARGLKKTYKAAGNVPAKDALKGIDLDKRLKMHRALVGDDLDLIKLQEQQARQEKRRDAGAAPDDGGELQAPELAGYLQEF